MTAGSAPTVHIVGAGRVGSALHQAALRSSQHMNAGMLLKRAQLAVALEPNDEVRARMHFSLRRNIRMRLHLLRRAGTVRLRARQGAWSGCSPCACLWGRSTKVIVLLSVWCDARMVRSSIMASKLAVTAFRLCALLHFSHTHAGSASCVHHMQRGPRSVPADASAPAQQLGIRQQWHALAFLCTARDQPGGHFTSFAVSEWCGFAMPRGDTP